MVDVNLRVKGQLNIFAAGDIIDIPELEQGYFVQMHAMMVPKNIKLLMHGDKDSKLLKYKHSTTMLCHLVRRMPWHNYPSPRS